MEGTNYGYNNQVNPVQSSGPQEIILKPKLGGFLFTYILFSLPSFLISSLVLIGVLIFFVFGLIGSIGSSVSQDLLPYRVISDSPSDSAILIYDLQGAIQTGTATLPDSSRATGVFTEIVKRDFAKIKEDESIKGVVFRMNTPGGSVFASEVLGDLITDLMEYKNQSQAIYYYDQIVASGGIWSAMKTNNFVVANPYGETGSIGVVLSLPNYSDLANNIGYSETVIKSSDSKDIGNPLRDITDTEMRYFQEIVDQKYNQFVSVVAKGRGIEVSAVQTIANGYLYSNEEALELGLVDELGDIEKASKKAAEIVNISEYDVLAIDTEIGLLDSFFSKTESAINRAQPIKTQDPLQQGVVYAIDINRNFAV